MREWVGRFDFQKRVCGSGCARWSASRYVWKGRRLFRGVSVDWVTAGRGPDSSLSPTEVDAGRCFGSAGLSGAVEGLMYRYFRSVQWRASPLLRLPLRSFFRQPPPPPPPPPPPAKMGLDRKRNKHRQAQPFQPTERSLFAADYLVLGEGKRKMRRKPFSAFKRRRACPAWRTAADDAGRSLESTGGVDRFDWASSAGWVHRAACGR
jgi:hypothetical protein